MALVYFESSAFVKLVTEEAGSAPATHSSFLLPAQISSFLSVAPGLRSLLPSRHRSEKGRAVVGNQRRAVRQGEDRNVSTTGAGKVAAGRAAGGNAVSGPGQLRQLVQLQQSVGNRTVVSALGVSKATPVVQRWPWSKKKPTVSAPKNGRAMTQEEHAGVISNAQLLALPLRDFLAHLLDNSAQSLEPNDLKVACDRASQDQRDAVYADKQLMDQIEKKLTTHQYIAFLSYLRVVEAPTTGALEESSGRQGGHTSAKEADAIIQDKMQKYVAEAVRAGKQVSGQVAIVSDADFRKAYLDEYGPTDTEVDETNAFVRHSDRLIVIHGDRGNAGTTIHEGLHKYSSGTLLSKAGFHVNEGVTEFFTRQICESLPDPIVRGNYEDEFDVIKVLVALVGQETLAQAYFGGSYDKLVAAFAKTGKSKQAWAGFVQAMEDKKFGQALRLLK